MSRVSFERLRVAANLIKTAQESFMCCALAEARDKENKIKGLKKKENPPLTAEEYLIFKMHNTDKEVKHASQTWVLFDDGRSAHEPAARVIREQLLLEIELNMKAQGFAQ